MLDALNEITGMRDELLEDYKKEYNKGKLTIQDKLVIKDEETSTTVSVYEITSKYNKPFILTITCGSMYTRPVVNIKMCE